MKRAAAFLIDEMVFFFLLFSMMIAGISWGTNIMGGGMMRYFFKMEGILWLYFFLNDLIFDGYSVGKKILKINIQRKPMGRLWFSVAHSVCKTLFANVWFVTIIIYLINKQRMPYDRFFYETIDENYNEQISWQIIVANMVKRFGALFIDLLLAQIIYSFVLFGFTLAFETLNTLIFRLGFYLVYLAYSFICDYWYYGITPGKKIIRVRVFLNPEKRLIYSLTHGILRFLCYMLAPIIIIYYLVKGRMPYDEWYAT